MSGDRLCLAIIYACTFLAMPVNAEAAPANGPLEAFFERHCYDCHSGAKPEAGLDLAMLPRNFSDPAALRRLVLIHDRIAKGEMPPAEVERPSAADVAAVTTWLDAELHAADAARIEKSGRARIRRMTRSEFENTAKDLLALDRLDIQSLLPEDGRVAGYDKIADGLDLSPVHLAAYVAAVEKALDAAIATRSTGRRRVQEAGVSRQPRQVRRQSDAGQLRAPEGPAARSRPAAPRRL
ncbi:DUF1587 domain-containing protein [bacterium]|nr:DUF1587 domain-containing protein [bacterium]